MTDTFRILMVVADPQIYSCGKIAENETHTRVLGKVGKSEKDLSIISMSKSWLGCRTVVL